MLQRENEGNTQQDSETDLPLATWSPPFSLCSVPTTPDLQEQTEGSTQGRGFPPAAERVKHRRILAAGPKCPRSFDRIFRAEFKSIGGSKMLQQKNRDKCQKEKTGVNGAVDQRRPPGV